MTIMIAVDILGCTGSMEERASLLHKTIQLAAELKSTMGNMFSFAAVMNALEMTQVCPQGIQTPLVQPQSSLFCLNPGGEPKGLVRRGQK